MFKFITNFTKAFIELYTGSPKPPICVYHDNCLDGVAAAWVVDRYFDGEVEFIKGNYYKDIDVNYFKNREVYLVDFSYKRDTTLDILKVAKKLVVLDHHKSAKREIGDLFNISDEHSGCMLAWNYFFPNEMPYRELLLIEDRDLWKFDHLETKDFCAYAFYNGLELKDFSELMKESAQYFTRVVKRGALLNERHDKEVKNLINNVRSMQFGDYTVPIVNVGYEYASTIGNILSKDADFAVMYQDLVEGRRFSLRSKKGGVDVSRLAEKFGGGGHKEAAGFMIKYDDPQFNTSHLTLDFSYTKLQINPSPFLGDIKDWDVTNIGLFSKELAEQEVVKNKKLETPNHTHKDYLMSRKQSDSTNRSSVNNSPQPSFTGNGVSDSSSSCSSSSSSSSSSCSD